MERIACGPEYRARFIALVGESPRVLESNCYVSPTYTTYLRTDGQVVRVVDLDGDSAVTLYADLATYAEAKRRAWYVDPETGRIVTPQAN